jgi:hypothetical protein
MFFFSQKKIKKTQVDVRSQNAKKFMNMFNKGEIPEGVSSADRQDAHSVPLLGYHHGPNIYKDTKP